jgi:hypothetical protein
VSILGNLNCLLQIDTEESQKKHLRALVRAGKFAING